MIDNQTEIELHRKLHANKKNFNSAKLLKNKRLSLFPLVEKILGEEISGEILDIGAGSGYAGVWLATERNVSVTALECTVEATKINIPKLAQSQGVSKNVKPFLGSFYKLDELNKKFNYVVCFGSIHHSADLYLLMTNIYNSLKPGGILIACEPYTDNLTPNHTFNKIYNMEEFFEGETIRHGDRHDHFYRECEYYTALHYSNFEIIYMKDVKQKIVERFKNIAYKMKRSLFSEKKHKDFKETRSRALRPKSILFVAKKPMEKEKIPHVWGKIINER